MIRNLIFSLSICLTATIQSSSQELISKKGMPILPENGDYAIGINATPFLNYFGNFLHGDSTTNTVTFAFFDNAQTLYGKYFLKPNLAIRGKFRISVYSQTLQNYVQDDASSDPFIMVTDSRKQFSQNYSLTGGIEKRRGKGRLQGIYGAELAFGFSSSSSKYTYGNPFTSTIVAPTTTVSFDNNPPLSLPAGTRTTSLKSGTNIFTALRAFAGIEFFFVPKISVGGEFGWGPSFTKYAEGTETIDYWNASNAAISSSTIKTAGSSEFSADSDNLQGVIFILFHF
ncbi:MAG: hypothetical protein V2A54_12120 [Bacteroidota bacterium]